MAKLPALQFYTGDWMKDPPLRAVSFAARGLWIDMLCLMSESDPRGFLKLNGKPVTPDQLARMTGGQADEVSRLLTELETAGVFSTDRGIIFSRRIVRDEHKRQLCAQAGKKGGGNPALAFKGHSKGRSKPPLNTPEDEDEVSSGEGLGEGDELDSRINAYVSKHRRLMSLTPKQRSAIRVLVTTAGWNETSRLIDEACTRPGVRDVIAYAATINDGNLAKAEMKQPRATPSGEWQAKKYCPG